MRRWIVTALDALGLGPRPTRIRMGPEFVGVVEATLADIPDIVELELPVFREHREYHPGDFQQPMNAPMIADFYRQVMFDDDWGIAVFVADRSTIGYVAWTAYEQFEGRHALIHSIAVNEAGRRRGIARALLAFAETQADARGLASIRANVWAHNEASRAFFASNGFYPVAQLMGRSIRAE
ncbi:MAG: GNAT family N-acetyltransferase [Paracoccaceae bacterium]|nr:GNAT family N-acetyltransferase [Paracoccaceae bacterium]